MRTNVAWRRAAEFERRADPHRRVGMQKGVVALRLDAEQQVEEGREGGRFAGLVRAVDDVQVGPAAAAFAEIERPLR